MNERFSSYPCQRHICFPAPFPVYMLCSASSREMIQLLLSEPQCFLSTSLVDVVLSSSVVFRDEVLYRMLGQPSREGSELFTEAVHRLLIHVGLGNQFWK